jgi:hypothetical protein
MSKRQQCIYEDADYFTEALHNDEETVDLGEALIQATEQECRELSAVPQGADNRFLEEQPAVSAALEVVAAELVLLRRKFKLLHRQHNDLVASFNQQVQNRLWAQTPGKGDTVLGED